MNAVITYNEILNLIQKKSKICPTFTAIDNKTLKVSCKPNMFIPEITVSVHIDAISKNAICLSYDCAQIATVLVSGVVESLKSAIPDGVKINPANKHIDIYPESFKKVAKVYEYISLSDIVFTDDAISILCEI